MQIWPAIDLLGGAAVRLSKGDYAKSTVYFKDPSRILEFFEKAEASHLHVVDLDGSAMRSGSNGIWILVSNGSFLEP